MTNIAQSFTPLFIMKNRHLLLALLFSFILVYSCNDDSEETQQNFSISEEIYSELQAKFENGLLLKSFSSTVTEKYTAIFSDNSTLEIDAREIRTIVCTPLNWPTIKLNSANKWMFNNTTTDHELNTQKKSVVALIYDTEGLYVRSSDGQILFFHFDEARQIGCFRFEVALNPQLSSDLICQLSASQIKASLPSGVSGTGLVATVAFRGSKMEIDGTTQISSVTSNNFNSSKTLKITLFNGRNQEFEVQLNPFKNIPIIRITTENNAPIVSKDDYINARITINDTEKLYSTSDIVNVLTEIRGRGNSTWGMPKKPYKLKLDKKTALLGMSTDKEWALLANYSDKALMRNYIIFELSQMLNMSWTPQARPVELYLNGTFQGAYTLTEQVKVSDERINITTVGSGDNAGDALTGGYFLEIDERYDGVNFTTSKGLPIVFKEPKEPTTLQYNYVHQYFEQIESVLYSSTFTNPTTGYAAYIDVESFVANYIIQELSKNVDGNMRLSAFFTKERNGKLKFSNVWDFDLALGNADYFSSNIGNGPTGFHIRNSRWYDRLFQDPAFVAKVKAEWARIYPQIYRLEVSARNYAAQISPAQSRNFQAWSILGKYVWPNVVWPPTYNEEVNYMIKFLNERANWMNQQINTW